MKWNVTLYGLLFSGLGAFSYLLLANYSDLSPHVADMLFSKGAFIFFITAFNILGCSTLRLSSWLNSQYALNIRKRWKIITIYIAVTLLFFLLNYSLSLNPQLHSRSATYKRNGLLIRKTAIKSSRPFQCAYYPLTP